MNILKLIKSIAFLIFFISCRNIKSIKYNYQHKEILLKEWDIKKSPIKKAILYSFMKDSNFSILNKSLTDLKITDYSIEHNAIFLKFESLPVIATDQDYKLIINDTIIYKITSIKTSKIIKKHGPRRVDTIYNMIKSMNINGKDYQFDRPRVFSIPKDTYTIEK